MFSAAEDASVDADTEEREAQVGDVVDVANDDVPAAHVDGDESFASNWNLAIIGEGDVLVVRPAVGDEGFVGIPEVVSSPAIKDYHLRVGSASSGKDLVRTCRYCGHAKRTDAMLLMCKACRVTTLLVPGGRILASLMIA